MKTRCFWACLAAAVSAGLTCGCTSEGVGTHRITRSDAIEMAEAAAVERGWSSIRAEDARQEDGEWRVLVWRLTPGGHAVPGGHALVRIGSRGDIEWVPGE